MTIGLDVFGCGLLWFGRKDTTTILLFAKSGKVSTIIFEDVTIAALGLVLDLR